MVTTSGRAERMNTLTAETPISDAEFEAFRRLVHEVTGIALGPQKRCLVQARLGRRLRALALPSYGAYHRYLTQDDAGGLELTEFINAITTNKTDFFREPHHFEYLRTVWAPALVARAARTGDRRVRLWSAACSSGEEPYTIAMTVREALGAGWDLRILASDIDTDVLARAEAGVYTGDQLAPVPAALRERYFTREADRRFRVRRELAELIAFRRINFMDEAWPIRTRFDVIFCRNVLIYFDRDGQRRVVERLLSFLADGGSLCLGHSESVIGLADGVRHVGNTIYRKTGADDR
jgi:chemotaxis protein methyltransferase CheR